MEERSGIILEFARTQDSGDPYETRFETQDYLRRSQGGSYKSEKLTWDKDLMSDMKAMRYHDKYVVQRFGERLRLFLESLGWQQLSEEIRKAVNDKRKLVLTIRSAAAELYALPWELATLDATGEHVGELESVLVRYEWPGADTRDRAKRTTLETERVLMAWSDAGGSVPSDDHIEAIKSACEAGHVPFNAELDVVRNASLASIEEALSASRTEGRPATVLHILCHGTKIGGSYGLALGDPDCRYNVDAARIRQILSPYADMVRLVVLCACDSGNIGELGLKIGSVAQTLHRVGFHSVIASRFLLSVQASTVLSSVFYKHLLKEPESLESAFTAARRHIAREVPNSLDWASLQLYARDKDGYDSRPITFRPYRGLLEFLPEHERFFFGRETEFQTVLQRLNLLNDEGRPRFLIVDGASGSGKSSLLKAKVIPALHTQGWQCRTMRPESKQLKELLEELRDAFDELARDDGRALLLVDQFEEIFTAVPIVAKPKTAGHGQFAEERGEFVRHLWEEANNQAGRLSVIVSMRSDFRGHCGDIALEPAAEGSGGRRLDALFAEPEAKYHSIFISRPGTKEMQKMIQKPADLVGLKMPLALCNQILADMASEPGSLPLLEFVLDEMWRRHISEGTSLEEIYVSMEGVSGALEKHANSVINKLKIEEQLAARRLLVRLVHRVENEGDQYTYTRLLVALSALRPSDKTAGKMFDRVVDKLTEARMLVRSTNKANDSTVEFAHEALIRSWPCLQGWLKDDAKKLDEIKRIEDWVLESRMFPDKKLKGDELDYARQVLKRYEDELSDGAKTLIKESEKEAEEIDRKRRKRKRKTFIIIFVVAVIFAAPIYLFLSQRQKTEEANTVAEKVQNAALDSAFKLASDMGLRPIRVLRNDVQYYRFSGLKTVQSADMNGDGLIDIVFTASPSSIGWLENLGKGKFSEKQHLMSLEIGSLHRPALGDVDGDGDTDIVAISYNLGQPPSSFLVLLNDGRGTLKRAGDGKPVKLRCQDTKVGERYQVQAGVETTYTAKCGPVYAELGQVVGDNNLDLVVSTIWRNNDFIIVLKGDGQGNFNLETVVPEFRPQNILGQPRWFALLDIDANGSNDIVGVWEQNKHKRWTIRSWLNRNGRFEEGWALPLDANPLHLAIGNVYRARDEMKL
jgi:hypothetical protein